MKGGKDKTIRQQREVYWPDGSVEIVSETSRRFFKGRWMVKFFRQDEDEEIEVPLAWLKARNRSKP